jgi:hypothetical protein
MLSLSVLKPNVGSEGVFREGCVLRGGGRGFWTVSGVSTKKILLVPLLLVPPKLGGTGESPSGLLGFLFQLRNLGFPPAKTKCPPPLGERDEVGRLLLEPITKLRELDGGETTIHHRQGRKEGWVWNSQRVCRFCVRVRETLFTPSFFQLTWDSRQGTTRSSGGGRHLPPFQAYTITISAIPSHPSFLYVCRTLYARAGCLRGFSTIVVQPINVFHAFVNGAAEAGQTQISLSLGLALSCYGIQRPLWRLTVGQCFITHHRTP